MQSAGKYNKIPTKRNSPSFRSEQDYSNPWYPTKVIENTGPVVDITENADPVVDITENTDPVVHIIENADPVVHIIENADPVVHITENADPVADIIKNEDPVFHIIRKADPAFYAAKDVDPVLHKLIIHIISNIQERVIVAIQHLGHLRFNTNSLLFHYNLIHVSDENPDTFSFCTLFGLSPCYAIEIAGPLGRWNAGFFFLISKQAFLKTKLIYVHNTAQAQAKTVHIVPGLTQSNMKIWDQILKISVSGKIVCITWAWPLYYACVYLIVVLFMHCLFS